MLALSEFRVLDLTDLKGQFAGKVLADLGLEVIKVEPPGGDPVRQLGPFKDQRPDPETSLPFLYLNANKKSITLDIERPEGKAVFERLARRADVVLESFPPGYLDQRGLGYRALAESHPGLILTSVTGFGQEGPHAHYGTSDLVALAMGGLLYISGEPGLPPCSPPETQAFYTASAYAALASLFALYHRQVSAKGQHIDVSIQEAIAVEDQILSSYANEGYVMRREGAQHKQVSPANVFPCRDGFVYLFVSAGGHWKKWLELWPDHPPAFDAPEWESTAYRRENAAVINEAVEQFTRHFARSELICRMQSHGIPCLPVNTPREFLEDEQVLARGFLQPISHPRLGSYPHPGTPYIIDERRGSFAPAPTVGQHNREVYRGLLEMDSGALEELRARGVV